MKHFSNATRAAVYVFKNTGDVQMIVNFAMKKTKTYFKQDEFFLNESLFHTFSFIIPKDDPLFCVKILILAKKKKRFSFFFLNRIGLFSNIPQHC